MAIIPPRLRDISFCLAEEDENSSKVWEISAPAKNSFYWSLILSYVIKSRKNNLWHKSSELLLGSNTDIDFNGIQRQVMNFNPFKHRFSIYFNKNLSKVLQCFKKRLNSFAGNKRNKNEAWDNVFKFKYAAVMLECDIVVCETESTGDVKVHHHKFASIKSSVQIIIFQLNNVIKDEKERDIFSFGIDFEHANTLRRDALIHIFKKVECDQYAFEIFRKGFQFDQNFLLFLFTSGLREIVPRLYKSPYIAWKLNDAGFNMDPCSLREGKLSAFYYCMSLDNIELLYILYNYAANNSFKTVKTVRTPDLETLEGIKRIAFSLKSDVIISQNFETLDNEKQAIKTCKDISLFNTYQSDVVEEMYGIIQKFPTEQRSEKIIALVFQNYLNCVLPQSDSFEHYIKFTAYCGNVDNYTCLVLFDNILALNDTRITKAFLDVVLRIFLTVLGNAMFPKCEHGIYCSICSNDIKNTMCASRIIPYTQRIKLRHAAEILLPELKNDLKQTKTDANKVLEKVRKSLEPIPQVTDEFLAARLSSYLNIATNVSLEMKPLEGVLTIERTLQVIGEILPTSRVENKLLFGYMLKCCIPTETFSDFIRLRNHCLSKYRPNAMNNRLELENDLKRYQNIQKELKVLRQLFKPIFSTQFLNTERFLINTSKKDLSSDNIHPSSQSINDDYIREGLRTVNNLTARLMRKLHAHKKNEFQSLINNALIYFLDFIEATEESEKKLDSLKTSWKGLNSLISFVFKTIESVEGRDLEVLKILENIQSLFCTNKDFTPQLKINLTEDVKKVQNILQTILPDYKKAKHITGSDFLEINKLFIDIENIELFSKNELSLLQEQVSDYTKNEDKLQNKSDVTSISFENISDLTKFSGSKKGKILLLQIPSLPCELRKKLIKFLNLKINILLNRIENMKKILIDSDEEISNMWRWGRSTEIKKHYRYLMGQHFVKEKEVRASLEMLLFDCMNILSHRKDLSHLWTKATGLYTGMNLRDFLSHGSTLLENVGNRLSPDDLPSQLIEKILELIEDGDAIRALLELWIKKEPITQEELEGIINNDKDNLAKNIKKSNNWISYSLLLPCKDSL